MQLLLGFMFLAVILGLASDRIREEAAAAILFAAVGITLMYFVFPGLM